MDEFHGYFIEDLAVGMRASHARTITETDLVLFSGITGDTNPMHLNRSYAASTRFKEPIAHGLLVAGLISAVLGTKLPGYGCLYVSQELRFLAPVKIGDTVVAEAIVVDVLPEERRVTLATSCAVDGVPVIEGSAVMSVRARRRIG